MIKQHIDVNGYWRVIVCYDTDYNSFYDIISELKKLNISNRGINNIVNKLFTTKAKAVTVSSNMAKCSLVVFKKHNDRYDYVNSIVHEAEHIKQAMLGAYNVPDEREAPAYTIGFLVMKMMEFYMEFLCR